MRNLTAAMLAAATAPLQRCEPYHDTPADPSCPEPPCIDPCTATALDLADIVNNSDPTNPGVVPPLPPVPSTDPDADPTALKCGKVIPPWKGHHGGVDACVDGKGRVVAFVQRPEVPDPFA